MLRGGKAARRVCERRAAAYVWGVKPSKAVQIYCDSANPPRPQITEGSRGRDPPAPQKEGRQPSSPGRGSRDHEEHALPNRAGRKQPIVGDRPGNREGARDVRGGT